ncbi:unnamed protein product [Anisakis simplex]|uniref:Uncharacterized protein n=1 Tax=Anisakis simplex TaxID=6269 RepID=A0A0M3KCL3_ANISI|nr:unnamed protein product [Anisakis simplex]
MNDSIERFTEEQHRYSAKPTALTDSVTTKTRRDTTKLSTPIQRSTTTRKSPHSHTIIQPQYGPIGLNNPSAVLFNATLSPYRRRYQTIKIGPTPLPTFNTPPMPRRPSLKTNVNLELGPDWRSYGKRPKSTASTKIRRPITSRTDKILTTAATSTHSLGETTSEKSRTDADKDLNLSKADEKLDKAKQFERHEQKNNGREMIILSPDEDPIEVSNNASLISAMNNLGMIFVPKLSQKTTLQHS